MSAPEIEHQKRRVFFYVDGFNLYHRRLENNPALKWLCLKTLASTYLFPKDNVAQIKLFTAKVDPKFESSPKQRRQQHYWDAIKSTGVEVIEGLLEPRERQCKAMICDKKGSFSTMSEKMTDVNLALHIYRDFIEKTPDVIAVLSGDLDIIPALKMVRESAKSREIRVANIVILPTQDDGLLFSRLPQHYQVARTTQLSETFLQKSLLPVRVEVMPGEWRDCPDTWKSSISTFRQ